MVNLGKEFEIDLGTNLEPQLEESFLNFRLSDILSDYPRNERGDGPIAHRGTGTKEKSLKKNMTI